jgi:hypothetical protein
MAEIDVSGQAANGPVTIGPGNDYLVGWSVSTSLDYKWVVWGDKPFEVEVKGLRSLFGPIPNPFNSGWQAAENPIQGSNYWGKGNTEAIITHYVVVRTGNPGTKIRFSSSFTGGGIIIPI